MSAITSTRHALEGFRRGLTVDECATVLATCLRPRRTGRGLDAAWSTARSSPCSSTAPSAAARSPACTGPTSTSATATTSWSPSAARRRTRPGVERDGRRLVGGCAAAVRSLHAAISASASTRSATSSAPTGFAGSASRSHWSTTASPSATRVASAPGAAPGSRTATAGPPTRASSTRTAPRARRPDHHRPVPLFVHDGSEPASSKVTGGPAVDAPYPDPRQRKTRLSDAVAPRLFVSRGVLPVEARRSYATSPEVHHVAQQNVY